MSQEIIKKAVEALTLERIEHRKSLREVLKFLSSNSFLKVYLILRGSDWGDIVGNMTYCNLIDPVSKLELVNQGRLGTVNTLPVLNLLTNAYQDHTTRIEYDYPMIYLEDLNEVIVLSDIILENKNTETTIQVGDENWKPTKENLESVEKVFSEFNTVREITEIETNHDMLQLKEINLDTLPTVDEFKNTLISRQQDGIADEDVLSLPTEDSTKQEENVIAPAMVTLRTELQKNDDYTWSWHCNIAMPIFDSIEGVTLEQANKTAAVLMRHIWGVDTSLNEYYEYKVKESQ